MAVSRALDPQLHTHFTVFNATFDETERCWKALQAGGLYDAIRYGTAVYRNELAKQVQQIGYRIQPSKHGFQIEGVSDEVLKRFSKRSQQRDAVVQELEQKLGRKLSNNAISHAVHQSLAIYHLESKTPCRCNKYWTIIITKLTMKSAQTVDRRIFQRIRSSEDGSVFSPAQFLDLGNRSAVGVGLHRLAKAGKIRRVRRGLYDLPRSHPITGQTAPNIMAAVRTLMNSSHARWQFTGAYAANALGLSNQVPSKIIIQTDGVPRKLSLGKLILIFRRAAPRNLLGAGRRAGLVIQALRYLHSSPEMSRHIARLTKTLDAATKRDLASILTQLPAWMRPLAQQIFKK